MDILPPLDLEAVGVADNNTMMDEDDPGEFVPCHFSDDEEEAKQKAKENEIWKNSIKRRKIL